MTSGVLRAVPRILGRLHGAASTREPPIREIQAIAAKHGALCLFGSRRVHAPTSFVSAAPSGRQWRAQELRLERHRMQELAGVARWTFHALRHYFVTTLFRVGTPAHVVQKLAGHLHLTVTQRYAHAPRDELRRAIQALGGGGRW